jgi:hypothetical protein
MLIHIAQLLRKAYRFKSKQSRKRNQFQATDFCHYHTSHVYFARQIRGNKVTQTLGTSTPSRFF